MKEKSAAPSCSCSTSPQSTSEQTGCCSKRSMSWFVGTIASPTGVLVPQIATTLSYQDIWGSWKARWGVGRMDYKVSPGLYGVGSPTEESPVLVTANYKMSFDRLRSQLAGRNLWILVLDTKGINVWCAAGKGTFGTNELVGRVKKAGLAEIVTHRSLVLPQLGAPGVAAPEVLKATGFKVTYGPVRAEDLPEFLDADGQATEQMREVRFGWRDRVAVIPMELVSVIKPALFLYLLLFFLNWLAIGAVTLPGLLIDTAVRFIPYLGALLTGVAVVPLLLPFIPGRAFAWKGWLVGLLWALGYIALTAPRGWGEASVYLLLLPAIASFLAMNFTGASTYTSLSGVIREMKLAMPCQLVAAGLGLLLLILRIFVRF